MNSATRIMRRSLTVPVHDGGWVLIERRWWTPGWVMAIVESRQAATLSQFSAAYAVVSAHGSEEGRRIAGDLFEVVMAWSAWLSA